MSFQEIIKYFNSLGFRVSESTDPLLLLLCVIVILAIVGLLCVLNILIYIYIVYISSNSTRLVQITSKLSPFFTSLLNLYKTTRRVYIVTEVLLLLVCLLSIIWLGGRVIIGLLY